MIPVKKLWDLMIGQLGDTTVTFTVGLSSAMWILPVKVPFTPGLSLTFTDATDLATFAGSTPAAILTGERVPATDPLTGRLTINLPGPVGGFLWTCTADPAVPETIYGVCLSSSSTTIDTTKAFASALLPEPVLISLAGDFVEFEDNKLQFNPAMVS